MIRLTDLKPGQRAIVVGFDQGDAYYRRQLMVMGITPKTQIELVRVAPMGDPVQIRVRQTRLSLRKDEAVLLKLERV